MNCAESHNARRHQAVHQRLRKAVLAAQLGGVRAERDSAYPTSIPRS